MVHRCVLRILVGCFCHVAARFLLLMRAITALERLTSLVSTNDDGHMHSSSISGARVTTYAGKCQSYGLLNSGNLINALFYQPSALAEVCALCTQIGHTHIHTHTHSLSLSLCLCLCRLPAALTH